MRFSSLASLGFLLSASFVFGSNSNASHFEHEHEHEHDGYRALSRLQAEDYKRECQNLFNTILDETEALEGLEKEDARSVFERMSRDWVDQLRMRDLDFIQSISGIPDANHLVIEMLAEATSSRIEHLGGMFTILFQILAAQKRR